MELLDFIFLRRELQDGWLYCDPQNHGLTEEALGNHWWTGTSFHVFVCKRKEDNSFLDEVTLKQIGRIIDLC